MATVYDSGAAAFKAGKSVDDNPHNRFADSLAYSAWRSGYDFAKYLASVKG